MTSTPFSNLHSRIMLSQGRSNQFRSALPKTPRSLVRTTQRPVLKPKRRFVINKIILNNFKSYFGQTEIGPFHKSFSAIVGPNGSGKSNIIDALLFVFGFRANKMRQAKLSELIHSSRGHENLDACSVDVCFEEILDLPGSDNYEVLPQSQLVISRQAFRNNASKYFINGRQSNYTEVTSLLKERGIDLDHKRFLILQGEVELISQMKPKAPNEHEDGLLEYIEDIIGTSKYKIPLEEANEKVETLNEERSEKLNRVKIVEKQKRSLEAKKKEAEDYLRDENTLSLKKSSLYQRKLLECKINIETSTKAMNKLKDQLREENEKHVQIKQDNKYLEDKYRDSVNAFQKLDKETNESLTELANYEQEDIDLEERKKHAISKQKKVTMAISTNLHGLSEAKSAMLFNEQDLNDRMEEMASLERSLEAQESDLDKIRESLRVKSEVYSNQIEEKQRELAHLSEKIIAKQSLICVKQSEFNILKEKVDSIKQDHKKAEEYAFTLRESCRKKNQIKDTKLEIQQLESDLKHYLAQKEHLKSSLADSRQQEDEAKKFFESSQSRGIVLSSLIELKDNDRIKGLYDRLGNLGVIDDKYDVAITTACPALDNIVVDSVEVGQTCIDYLRSNDIGRATFITLDELPTMDMRPIKTPENVPRLFDLVKPRENIFIPAFYSVLGNTLVAQDLTRASRIAFGEPRWRVVTLVGQVLEKSGAMSGGGHLKSKSAMSSRIITSETIAKLEKDRVHLETQWHRFQQNLGSLEAQLQYKKEEIPKLEFDILKLETDAAAYSQCSRKRASELRRLNDPSIDDTKNMARLKLQIDHLTQELDGLKRQPSKIEEEIKILQMKILEIGKDKLRVQKSKIDHVKDQLVLINERITKSQVAKSRADKDITKFENSLAKSERELEGLNNEIEKLTKEIQHNAQVSRSIRIKADEAKSILENKKEELDEIKEKLDEKTEIINRNRVIELKIKNQLEDCERNLAENKQKETHWRKSIAKLTLHEIGGDEEQEFQIYTDDELDTMNMNTLQAEIDGLKEKIQNANPNISVLEEYHIREKEYLSRANDLEEITSKRDECKEEYDRLRKQRLEEFMRGFTLISQKLKEMYQMITPGGNAELEFYDSFDPFSEGIIFSVMPPRKSWKNISNLSGGEKTISSLALVFALHHFKPTPIYVMDEIDAALDFRNVSIVANYIKERTQDAQFIVISLRDKLFESSDRLVGIYKTDDQ
ncbi:3953_t:CDS:10, partial [Funneliformis caledonium]